MKESVSVTLTYHQKGSYKNHSKDKVTLFLCQRTLLKVIIQKSKFQIYSATVYSLQLVVNFLRQL